MANARPGAARWVAATLLSVIILGIGTALVWFGVLVFLFGIHDAPYSNTAERIFNVCFGGMVLGGSFVIPLTLLNAVRRWLFKKPEQTIG